MRLPLPAFFSSSFSVSSFSSSRARARGDEQGGDGHDGTRRTQSSKIRSTQNAFFFVFFFVFFFFFFFFARGDDLVVRVVGQKKQNPVECSKRGA